MTSKIDFLILVSVLFLQKNFSDFEAKANINITVCVYALQASLIYKSYCKKLKIIYYNIR